MTVGSIGAAEEPKVKTERDIVYTKVGATELKLDVARPAQGDGPFPAVLVIHGGAWRGGDKGHMGPLLNEFANHGYVAVSPQYRFCPKEVFPAQVHDVKAAVRWLKTNAKTYRVDPERVGAIGFSAGGHLALMLGVTGPSDGLEGDAAAGSSGHPAQGRGQLFRPDRPGGQGYPGPLQAAGPGFPGCHGRGEARAGGQGLAPDLRFLGRSAYLDIPGDAGSARPLHPGDRTGRGDDRQARPGTGRVDGRAQHGWDGAELEHTKDETYRFFDRYLKSGTGAKKP